MSLMVDFSFHYSSPHIHQQVNPNTFSVADFNLTAQPNKNLILVEFSSKVDLSGSKYSKS